MARQTFGCWRQADSSISAPNETGLATLEWVYPAENLAVAGPAPAKSAKPPPEPSAPERGPLVHIRIVDRDRLLHHALVVLSEGSSLRLAEAVSGKGVKPLE